LTANKNIMDDIHRIFHFLEQPKTRMHVLDECKTLLVSPVSMRNTINTLITKEIKYAKEGKFASIIIKLNSISDELLIDKLYEAAKAGVEIKMVIRGISCMLTENKKFKAPVQAISIIDEYLEHARVMIFHNNGKERIYISSADWMVRNLDHRIEAACPIYGKEIQQELKDILQIQLSDNVKARILDNNLTNQYINPRNKKKVRSQVEIYNYLFRKLST
jgi:polyphosphate kinase